MVRRKPQLIGEIFINKLFPFQQVPDFGDFIKSWWPHRNDATVLVIPYEAMKKDLAGCIQRISKFLFGHEVASVAESEFATILRFCSFEYMSANAEKFTLADMKHLCEYAGVPYQPPVASLVRADGGQVGQGKTMLHDSIKRQVEKRWKDTVEKEYGFKNYQELLAKWQEEHHVN